MKEVIKLYISTNTLLAEGDRLTRQTTRIISISTNTLLGEGDYCIIRFLESARISTNTLLAEGDGGNSTTPVSRFIFQPTPSSRRVTICNLFSSASPVDFNQHPPRGG